MRDFHRSIMENIIKDHQFKRRLLSVVVVFSALVFTGVAWRLRLQGISLTDDVQYICGEEKHEHGELCYDTYLVCDQDDSLIDGEGNPIHVHTEECYGSNLVCGKEEHLHTMECLTENPIPVSGEEAAEAATAAPGLEEAAAAPGLEATTPALMTGTEGIDPADPNLADPGLTDPALLGAAGTTPEPFDLDALDPELQELLMAYPQLLELVQEDPGLLDLILEDPEQLDPELLQMIFGANGMMTMAAIPSTAGGNTPEEYGRIYVKTHLGEKWANYINEFLSGITEAPDVENKYFSNSPTHPFILYPGERIEICAYEPDSVETHSFAISGKDYGVLELQSQEHSVVASGKRRNSVVIQVKDRATVFTNSENPANSGWLRQQPIRYTAVDEDGNTEEKIFWVEVRVPDQNNGEPFPVSGYYTHADIEIADGGVYNVTETVKLPDGTVITVVSENQIVIVGVNACRLYDKAGNQLTMYDNDKHEITGAGALPAYRPSDYKESGEFGDVQYELTSEPSFSLRPARLFQKAQVERAEFDVSVLLKPGAVTATYSDGTPVTGFKFDTDNRIVQSAVFRFKLDHQSVIDAVNKCPNHTGLDFTVSEEMAREVEVDPIFIPLEARKTLTDQYNQNVAVKAGQFEFELLDSQGRVCGRATNDANGRIYFQNQIFLNAGTYVYTVREVIPDGAVTLSDGRKYYKDPSDPTAPGIYYDTTPKSITVQVGWEADIAPGSTLAEHNYKLELVSVTPDPITGSVVVENQAVDPNTPPSGNTRTDLTVRKVWDDVVAEDHSKQVVQFRVRRRINVGGVEGEWEEKPMEYNGQTLFTLSGADGWKTVLTNLPKTEGDNVYEYKVEEVNVPKGYKVSYESSNNGALIIKNKQDPTAHLFIQKKWQDVGGNELASPPNVDVNLTLKRKYTEVNVPVTIVVQDTDGRVMASWVKEYAVGEDGRVPLEISLAGTDPRGTLEHLDVYTNRESRLRPRVEGVQADNSGSTKKILFTLKDIEPNMVVTVVCDNALGNNDIIARYSRDSNTGQSPGSELEVMSRHGIATYEVGAGFTTMYTKSGDGASSFKAQGRTSYWNGLEYTDSRFAAEQRYSFSAYARYNNEYSYKPTENDPRVSVPLSVEHLRFEMALQYSNGGNTYYPTVALSEYATAGNWVHLSNDDFEIPAGADYRLYFQTNENSGSTQYTDFFIDDLIIAAAGVATDIKIQNGTATTFEYVRRTNPTYSEPVVQAGRTITLPAGAQYTGTYVDEPEWSRAVVLKSADSWKAELDTAELGELPNREYQYYVVENAIEGYEVSYEDDNVPSNTETTPIQVINKQKPGYSLPETGGPGTRGMQEAGALILLIAGISCIGVYRYRKRGESSA